MGGVLGGAKFDTTNSKVDVTSGNAVAAVKESVDQALQTANHLRLGLTGILSGTQI